MAFIHLVDLLREPLLLASIWARKIKAEDIPSINYTTTPRIGSVYHSDHRVCQTSNNNWLNSFRVFSRFHQTGLEELADVLFMGNPIYEGMSKEDARIEVLRHIPQVSKIDGDMVKPTERDAANLEAVAA